jgi:aminoglycoside phosphotransferase (APT) family kinase protein
MQKLSEHDIKVPNVLWYEPSDEVFGTSFYVMEMASGDAPSDNPPFHQEGWVADSSEDVREKIWWGWVEQMAKIHQVDISNGDFEFLNRPKLAEDYLDQELNYYFNFHDWAMDGEAHPVADQAREWLKANKPQPTQSSILWGDCRCANIMYDPDGQVSAVLDWEMAALGDPCMDLAWGIAIDDCNSKGVHVERLSGFPGPVATIAKWEALTGFSADDFDYYYILALYKFTVIMVKVVRKLEHYEIMPMGMNAHINNHVTPMLEAKLKEL